jgi:hypothetical protein
MLGIDGKPVQSTGQLRNVIASAGVGKIVKIEILRGGEKRTLSAKLDRLPAEKGVAGDSRAPADTSTGLGLAALDSALRQKLGAPPCRDRRETGNPRRSSGSARGRRHSRQIRNARCQLTASCRMRGHLFPAHRSGVEEADNGKHERQNRERNPQPRPDRLQSWPTRDTLLGGLEGHDFVSFTG